MNIRKLVDNALIIAALDEEDERLRGQLATSLQETAAAETDKPKIESVLRDNLVPEQKDLLKMKGCEQAQQSEQLMDFVCEQYDKCKAEENARMRRERCWCSCL